MARSRTTNFISITPIGSSVSQRMPRSGMLGCVDQRDVENRETAECVNPCRMVGRQGITGAASERRKWRSPARPLIAINEPGGERLEICDSSDNGVKFDRRYSGDYEGSKGARRFCRMQRGVHAG